MGKDITKRRQVRHTPLAQQLEDDNLGKKRVRVGKLAQEKEKDDITEEVPNWSFPTYPHCSHYIFMTFTYFTIRTTFLHNIFIYTQNIFNIHNLFTIYSQLFLIFIFQV